MRRSSGSSGTPHSSNGWTTVSSASASSVQAGKSASRRSAAGGGGSRGRCIAVDYARGPAGWNRFTMPLRRADGGEVSRPTRARPQAPVEFTLSYPAGSEYGRPYSPTHSSTGRRGGMERVSGRDAAANDDPPSSRRGSSASMRSWRTPPRVRDGFALLTVAPPATRESRRTPRDFTFVVDVSGSMSGRRSCRQRLPDGRAGDAARRRPFRIIDFSAMRGPSGMPSLPQPREHPRRERYIQGLEAEGGTNISGALEDACATRLRGDGSRRAVPH